MTDLIDRQAAIESIEEMQIPIMRSRFIEEQFVFRGMSESLQAIKNLPSAQEKRTEERTETHTCDLISRQEAIDAHYEYCNNHPDASFPVWSLKILEALPSAQPETHEERTETHACDYLSRQDAIDAVRRSEALDRAFGYGHAVDALRELPSAEPEIVQCRKCKFASGDSRICMKFGHSPIGELDFCSWAERRTDG